MQANDRIAVTLTRAQWGVLLALGETGTMALLSEVQRQLVGLRPNGEAAPEAREFAHVPD